MKKLGITVIVFLLTAILAGCGFETPPEEKDPFETKALTGLVIKNIQIEGDEPEIITAALKSGLSKAGATFNNLGVTIIGHSKIMKNQDGNVIKWTSILNSKGKDDQDQAVLASVRDVRQGEKQTLLTITDLANYLVEKIIREDFSKQWKSSPAPLAPSPTKIKT